MTTRIPLEKLLPKAGNSIYRLVRMASNRATELSEGKPKLVTVESDKETTIALREILEGRVIYKNVADQFPNPVENGAKDKNGAAQKTEQ